MTNGLFPDCKQDSPRLAWMRSHNIVTAYNCVSEEWCAQICDNGKWGLSAIHIEEDGALHDLAVKLGIPLWNEEAYMREHK